MDLVPEISRKMGLRQVEQGFSSFFAKYDDFLKVSQCLQCTLLRQIWQKYEEKP